MTWVQCRLGEIVTLKRGYDLPQDSRRDGDIAVVSSSGVTGFHTERKTEGPAVVTGRYGTLGEVFYLESPCWPLNTTLYVQDFKGNYPKFIYYFLKSFLKGIQSDKAAVPGLNRNDLHARSARVTRNSVSQMRIASILSAYDDLIENNRRRIKLLEESARLLYQEWFINFRFPGHEKTMFSNGLPEGWKRLTISDVADTVGGGTPSTNVHQYWEDGNVVWFVPKDLTNNRSIVLLDSERKITALGLSKSSAKMLPPETILMSSRASIGYFGIYEGACCTNQGFISCIPKLDYVRMYLLHNLMQRVNEIIGLAGGTTYKEINKTTFRAMSVILPEDKLLKTFDELAYTCLKQCRILMKQNQKLAEARDLLLPRLMSGEIEV